MPRLIGLTGGIASGKSTVTSLIRAQYQNQVEVIDADEIARSVVRRGQPAYVLVRFWFRSWDVVDGTSGELDRAKLGALVFAEGNARLRHALNRITHPFIVMEMLARALWAAVVRWRVLVVLDTPLLFESRNLLWLCGGRRGAVVVYCTPEQQLQRLLARNPELTPQQAEQRIRAQMPIDQKRDIAGYVINNVGSKEDLEVATFALFNELVKVDIGHRLFCTATLVSSVGLLLLISTKIPTLIKH
mmetsp:Transcript_6758/g.13791  ORF Transcript_6758/g.13791 Transcript_6758/m.13791 type:complete len:245 (+) Transcript_6758:4250-4984(+)